MPITQIIVGMMTQNSPASPLPDSVPNRIGQLRQGIQDAFGMVIPHPVIGHPPVAVPPVPQAIGGPTVLGRARLRIPAPPPVLQPPPPPPPMPQSVLRIFLAPEYFFRKQERRCQPINEVTAYTQNEKNAIKLALAGMSRMYDNFLLIGGSVFWLHPPNTIRHSVFVYHSGQLIHTYEKKNDCGELRPFETNMGHHFQAGVVVGRFDCAGLAIGVETCVDHELRQLKTDRVNGIDLQIIISNQVTLKPTSVAAHARGYVLHCNAGPYGCAVFRDPFSPDSKIVTDRAVNGNLTLGHWRLPWPAPVQAPAGGGLVVKN